MHTGQLSRVKFKTLKSRIVPIFPGILISLSPNITNSIATDAEGKKGVTLV